VEAVRLLTGFEKAFKRPFKGLYRTFKDLVKGILKAF